MPECEGDAHSGQHNASLPLPPSLPQTPILSLPSSPSSSSPSLARALLVRMRGRCKRALQLWRVLALASSSAFKHMQHPALDPVRLEHERKAQAASRRLSAARAWPEGESLARGRTERGGSQCLRREPPRENLSAGACGYVGGAQGREERSVAKRAISLPAVDEFGLDQCGREGEKTSARGEGDTRSPEEKAESVEPRHPDRSCCGTSQVYAFTAAPGGRSLRDCVPPQLPRRQAEQRELEQSSWCCAGGCAAEWM